jgi:hypothetical protein
MFRHSSPMEVVHWHDEAVLDFEEVRSREERKAVFNAVDKLARLGSDLAPPHSKKLRGESDWLELRPRQGSSPVRPLYVRERDAWVIYAIAPDKPSFDRALVRAKSRRARRDAG